VFSSRVIAERRIAARLARAFVGAGFSEADVSALERAPDDEARDARVLQARLDLQALARALATQEWAAQIRQHKGQLRPLLTKPLMVRAEPVYNDDIWDLAILKIHRVAGELREEVRT
jgi:hypothetical protein